VVKDYEFEIGFEYLKNLSTLTIHTYSYDGFYLRKRTFKHLPLTQIKYLEIDRIFKIDNDTFSNLTDIQTLLIWMGSKYLQEAIIRTFQNLDAFRDTNMTQLEIHANHIETSFKLDGNMLQYVQRIFLKRFSLSRMYITDIDAQAFTTFANYSTCLESLEISDNIIYHPKIEVFFPICYFRNLRSFVYSNNNQRIGHIKDKTPYVKYDVNNTNMKYITKVWILCSSMHSKNINNLIS